VGVLALKSTSVVFIVTEGRRSMDIYSRKLAEHLDVPKLYTDIYEKAARKFGISFLSLEAFKVFFYDLKFLLKLRDHNTIFHFPNQHLGRYAHLLGKPYIITVHDIIRYFDLKGYGPYIQKPNFRDKVYLKLDYRGVKKATKIIAVSNTTKQDIVKHLGVPESSVAVVYEGVDHDLFRPVEHRLMSHPYVLFVGSEQPRKNLKALLKAFAILKRRSGLGRLKLVKVGSPGNEAFRRETLKVIKELGLVEDVVFTGYIAEEDLPVYYSGALCFVLPSLYEGFGLPVLEAMACGCPVIVSEIPSLVEVADNAALKVNPVDEVEIADTIHEVATNSELREELIARGFSRAKMFSWEKAAHETSKVYSEVERLVEAGVGEELVAEHRDLNAEAVSYNT